MTSEQIKELQERDLTTQETIAMQKKYGLGHYDPLAVAPTHGGGPWLRDAEGKEYFDAYACYSADILGHNPPELITLMMQRFRENKVSTLAQSVYCQERAKFEMVLAKLSDMEKIVPMNTGGEGTLTSLKIAKRWGVRKKGIPNQEVEVISAKQCFHGRSLDVLSLSSEPHYYEDFGPLLSGCKKVDFGDIEALKSEITSNTAAIILERIQAEGGIILCSPQYLREVRALCDEEDILLILDEVQAGLMRTGQLFYYQHKEYEGTKPHMVVLGKGLGGGMAIISAVCGDEEVLGVLDVGSHGSTFAGNPLSCALATKTLEILTRPETQDNVARLSLYLESSLRALPQSLLEEFRGMGALWGMQLSPGAKGARWLCDALVKADPIGTLTVPARDNVVRITPTLDSTQRHFERAEVFDHIESLLKSR